MARKIERKVAEDTPANMETTEAETTTEKQTAPIAPPAPVARVEAPAKAAEPANSVTVKAPAMVVVRVLRGMVLFNDSRRTKRITTDLGKPVTITITQ